LGRYELLAQVARGGMGEVWVARLVGARGFQKLVAIKTLLPEFRDEARIEEMLLEEARIASMIHHPNVVQTTELGEHKGYLYLVMEWVDGESLSFLMKRAEERGWVPLPVAVNLVAQACRGLHAAHELTSDLGVHLGVVHRDVSPHNVLVTHGGVVKLVDFGIAKAMNEQGSLTANGELKGKYSFMAPEQMMSNDVDRRADVFALGISLYMLVTRRHPFKANTKTSVLAAVTSQEPATPPSKYLPSCPPALEAVILRALEKDPQERFQTADAMRIALEAAVPQAFEPRFEAVVMQFLNQTMGDRAAARREALRRFQLSADERALAKSLDTGAKYPSQSAGTMRAIMVDAEPDAQVAPGADLRLSHAPTQVGRRGKSRRLGIGVAAVAVVAFAGAFFARRLAPVQELLDSGPSVAAEGARPPEHAPPGPPAPPAASEIAATAAPPSADPVAQAAPSAEKPPAATDKTAPETPSSLASAKKVKGAAAPLTARKSAPADPEKPSKKKASRADAALDLMAPDYAK
jgi:serine/threonine-protein kinase